MSFFSYNICVLFGDGLQIRDFIHVSDIAEANLSAMLSQTNSGFFNIDDGELLSNSPSGAQYALAIPPNLGGNDRALT